MWNIVLLYVLYYWFDGSHEMYALIHVSTSIHLATIHIKFWRQLPLRMIATVSEIVRGRL